MHRVLLVDDDLIVLDTYERSLCLAHFTVATARTVSEAKEQLHQDFSAAVIDLRLPDGNGLDVLREFRKHHPCIPALIVTGFGTLHAAFEASSLGAVDFLEKPISIDELIEEIHHLIRPQEGPSREPTAHASARWARAVAPIVNSASDVRTIGDWSRLIAAAPGTIRNWCHTAHIPTRHSLIFGRLLRVVALSNHGRNRPEDLLDVVDLRTLARLFRLVGLRNSEDVPPDIFSFIDRQQLVKKEEAIAALKAMLPNVVNNLRKPT